MRLDFATLAFGYRIKSGGGTPNWATALGQGKEHKINETPEINEMLKGIVYSSVSLETVSTKIGKGGRVVYGNEADSPIVIAGVFSEVYVNNVLITNGKFILLITRDTSEHHAGRLRLKYGPSNTYEENGNIYSNQNFYQQVRDALNLASDACWFVTDIDVVNQSKLVLKAIIVNEKGIEEYENIAAQHAVWESIDPSLHIEDRVKNGRNVLYYGVPGAGKSNTIDGIIDKERTERVVFHPDYTYSDFIGQILPRLVKDENNPTAEAKLTYAFSAGPFTRMVQKAIDNPAYMHYLVIEEINRGNAPAIFGDVFQLLDRNDDGSGKYGISNYEMATEIFNNKDAIIEMPSNLTILATMNTSDQNVFTLDTAFQRRWEMKLIKNDVSKAIHANTRIDGTDISWGSFVLVTNDEILRVSEETGSSEDKRLGAYFARLPELAKDKFPEKVIKYLWDDAFKMDRTLFFNDGYTSLDAIIEEFETDKSGTDVLRRVLNTDVYSQMRKKESGETADTEIENDDVDGTP